MGGSGGSYDPKLPFNHRAHGQRQHGNFAYSFCACNAGALLLVNRVHMAGPTGMAKRFERRQCQTHRGIQAARCSIQHGNTRVAASPVPLPPLSFYRSTNGNPPYAWPGSNWRPSACWADVIATRPQVRPQTNGRMHNTCDLPSLRARHNIYIWTSIYMVAPCGRHGCLCMSTPY